MTLLIGTHVEMYLLNYVLQGFPPCGLYLMFRVIYIQLMLNSLVCNFLSVNIVYIGTTILDILGNFCLVNITSIA